MMRTYLLVILLVSFAYVACAQSSLLVKDVATGEIRPLKRGKVIGLVTATHDTLLHKNRDTEPAFSYWLLERFTDSTLTVVQRSSLTEKTYPLSQVKLVSFKRNESRINLKVLGIAGVTLMILSPLIGITNSGYNPQGAAVTFGVGLGLNAVSYFSRRNRDLRNYTITGVK